MAPAEDCHPDPVRLSTADIGVIEEDYVLRALRSGWVAPLGPDVDAFEAEVAERTGVAHALALSSGTAALHLALLGLGVGPDSVVILPSMTFAASANAVSYTGASTVFVDSLADDGNIDPDLLEVALRDQRQKGADVAAVMTVDLFGRACSYDRIESSVDHFGVPVVEDAAEALGASFDSRAAGSFGRAAALSFNGNKIMTTSGGGMLLSDDADLVAHARKRSTQARDPAPWYQHSEVGYNYRLSNVLAALGRAQLTRLDEMIDRRTAIRRQYEAAFSDLPVRFLGADAGDRCDNHWLTTMVVEDTTVDIDALIDELARGYDIEARHLWKPMHMQPLFAGSTAYVNGSAEHLFRHGLALPSGSALRDDEVERVIEAVTTLLGVRS